MTPTSSRRDFLTSAAAMGASMSLSALASAQLSVASKAPAFKISLAQWSLHQMLFDGKLETLDFPAFTKQTFGIDAVEYVNQFFKEKAKDTVYLTELKQRCADVGVQSVLIMCDGEGHLGDPNEAERNVAVENHYKWVEAAEFLGCHSIRVNAHSSGPRADQIKLAADGLRKLSEFAGPHHISVIVENHGGLSSDGGWLAQVIEMVRLGNCGTLPDFGNFVINRETGEQYDRYQGVKELMPFAKGVSAKSYAFDEDGDETTIDYRRMLEIVLGAGYHGYIGVEWEGQSPDEVEGVKLTKALLERVGAELAA